MAGEDRIPIYREILDSMDLFLHRRKYNRGKSTWNRKFEYCIHVIELQRSKHKDEVTINCGVHFPEVHDALWGSARLPLVEAPDCTVEARIGMLMPERLDLWWELSDLDDASELVEACCRWALPFLDEHSSVESAIHLLQQRSARQRGAKSNLELALLYHIINNNTDAKNLINYVIENSISEPWKQKAQNLLIFTGNNP